MMYNFFDYPGAFEALVASVLFGSFLALLGIPLVLRRRAFTGIALSETAAFGAALGAFIGAPEYVIPFLMVLGVLIALEMVRTRTTGEDGPVAVIYLLAAAAATLFVSKLPSGEADLLLIHFGNILAMSSADLWLGSAIAVVAGLTVIAISKPLLAVVNDPISAAASGLSPPRVLGLYAFLLAASVTYGLAIFGVIPVFGYLVGPGFLALRLSGSRAGWFVASVVIASVTSVGGLVLAFMLDFPPGPFIVGLMGAAAVAGWLVRR
jgi:ABC-type Mn2+/Zn2+ transport system permease subunit